EFRINGSAGENDSRGAAEAQSWPLQGNLQTGGGLAVVQQAVAQTERVIVERPRGGDADMPVTAAAGVILYRRLGSALKHVDTRGMKRKLVQVARCHRAAAQDIIPHQRAQIAQIGFNAVEFRFIEYSSEFFQC